MNGTILKNRVCEHNRSNRMNGTEPCWMNSTVCKNRTCEMALMMSIELIKINDSKNWEFEFLIFKTKTKVLQNFNETTHWNFL